MGNCNVLDKKEEFQEAMQSIRNYEILDILGKGGFGKVIRVRRKKNNQLYAMKIMSKAKIVEKKCVSSVLNEKNLLKQLHHPFIVNMHSAFQDRENLYLVLDLLSGGDLRYHLFKNKRFSEEEAQFFAACIIVSLEYLHQNGILHRDLKPENLVFDEQGYLRLTDMGIARVWRPDNASDTSGTPGYMAPEVMCKLKHGIAVDFFALGVILYECMLGKRPYVGKTRQEIRDQILSKQIQIKRSQLPVAWSIEAGDFINQLIQRKPENRLGTDNPSDVKNHPWFSAFDWEMLLKKKYNPPYYPKKFKGYEGSLEDTMEDENDKKFILLRNNTLCGIIVHILKNNSTSIVIILKIVSRSDILNDSLFNQIILNKLIRMSSAYITILSSNGIEFIVAKEIAGLSEIFRKQISNADMRGESQILSDFTADILEIILQYLHYKNRWQLESPINLPKFQIAKEKALSVLQAAIALQI